MYEIASVYDEWVNNDFVFVIIFRSSKNKKNENRTQKNI